MPRALQRQNSVQNSLMVCLFRRIHDDHQPGRAVAESLELPSQWSETNASAARPGLATLVWRGMVPPVMMIPAGKQGGSCYREQAIPSPQANRGGSGSEAWFKTKSHVQRSSFSGKSPCCLLSRLIGGCLFPPPRQTNSQAALPGSPR